MKLEGLLRADVDVSTVAESVIAARLEGFRFLRPLIIRHDPGGKSHQGFRVVQVGFGYFERVGRDVVIQGVDARGIGVTPCDQLQRRQAGVSEEVGERIHPDVGEDQDIHSAFRDRCLDRVQRLPVEFDVMVTVRPDPARQLIVVPRQRKYGYLEPAAPQPGNEPVIDPSDRM